MSSAAGIKGPINSPLLQLSEGGLSMALVPELGGSVAFFRKRGHKGLVDLMRPLSEAARSNRDPMGVAMFPMLPYANRIANNRFDFEGRTYEFDPTIPGQRFNLHGTGWTSAWRAATATSNAAKLTLDHLAPGEPYAYSAYQRFQLLADRLRVELGIVNRGVRAMPFGFGLHPWWPRHSEVKLRFHATHFWLESPEHLTTDCISIPPELDFSQSRSLPDTWRNNCYSGWDGLAEILFPSSKVGMRIEADPRFGHLMLYCDPAQPVFCLEPQTHASGALNRLDRERAGDLGLAILRAEESIAGVVSFTAFPLE